MIITISGSVGVGKSSIAQDISQKFDAELISLNEFAKKYHVEDIEELDTFDFDLDALLKDIEKELLQKYRGDKNVVLESHFAHFISPDIVDFLVIINRDLQELSKEYSSRGYNEQKIKDNLEVESFDLCFFEAEEEGYEPHQIVKVDNDGTLNEIVDEISSKILKRIKK